MPLTFFHHKFNALGSSNELQLYCEPDLGTILCNLVTTEVKRIEEKFSRFREESLVSQINRAAGSDQKIKVDDETSALLNYATAAFNTSDGLFDITSGILSRLWNFRERIIPSPADIQRTKALVGWGKAEWRPPYFRLPVAGMQIDFGGIGKEYAVDKVAGILAEHHVRNGLINFGGDIRVLGSHPDGRPWDIGISHPRLSNETLAAIRTFSGAIATSGDYERYFELDGKRYCHVINPRTGYPVEGVQAVTVFAQSCLIAGTATTVAMLYGPTQGLDYLNDLALPYIFVRSEEDVVVKGFAK